MRDTGRGLKCFAQPWALKNPLASLNISAQSSGEEALTLREGAPRLHLLFEDQNMNFRITEAALWAALEAQLTAPHIPRAPGLSQAGLGMIQARRAVFAKDMSLDKDQESLLELLISRGRRGSRFLVFTSDPAAPSLSHHHL